MISQYIDVVQVYDGACRPAPDFEGLELQSLPWTEQDGVKPQPCNVSYLALSYNLVQVGSYSV